MTTAVVEREQTVGGRCLNYACIPAKAVLRCADAISEIEHASEFGIIVGAPSVDFGAVTGCAVPQCSCCHCCSSAR
jgi:dihydrolipoamide dehydrogenase